MATVATVIKIYPVERSCDVLAHFTTMTPAGKRAVWVSDLPDRVVREAVRALEICADEVEPHVIHGPLISRAERLAYAGIETSRGDDEQSLRWTAGSRSAVGERHQIEARQRRTAWAVAELRSEP